jgi:hypothetical protein
MCSGHASDAMALVPDYGGFPRRPWTRVKVVNRSTVALRTADIEERGL